MPAARTSSFSTLESALNCRWLSLARPLHVQVFKITRLQWTKAQVDGSSFSFSLFKNGDCPVSIAGAAPPSRTPPRR